MSASHRSLLLASSVAAALALPLFAGSGDARAQPSQPASTLTPYPACTTKPTAQDSEAAHSAYLLGKRFFEESDYGSASHNFIDAYKLDCGKPELLLNIARANELLGNRGEAVHALETYLQRAQGLGLDDRAQLQRRIDNLKAAIAAQTPSPAPTVIVAPPPPTVAPVPTTSPSPPTPLPPPVLEDRHHTAAPWVLIGVGAAAAIAGGVVFFVGNGKLNDGKDACTATPGKQGGITCGPTAANDITTGEHERTAGAVVFYSGLGVAAVGVLWHFLEPTGPVKADPPKASFTPVFGPGYSGASFAATF